MTAFMSPRAFHDLHEDDNAPSDIASLMREKCPVCLGQYVPGGVISWDGRNVMAIVPPQFECEECDGTLYHHKPSCILFAGLNETQAAHLASLLLNDARKRAEADGDA